MSKFKRLLRPRNLVIFLFLAAFSIAILIPIGAALTIEQGYRSYSGTSLTVDSVTTKPYSAANRVCKVVVNNTGKDIFIPVNSESEWVLFKNAASGLGLTLNPCPGCGDGSCNNGETCYSCSSDCGTCPCGDSDDCAAGYYCYNGIAYCSGPENHHCYGFEREACTSVNCSWYVAQIGYCVSGSCTPSCSSRNCGPDGCGGSCGTCGATQICSVGGYCTTTSSCGNSTCDSGETCSSCPGDCGACCSDSSDCLYGQYCSGAFAYCTGPENHGCLDGYAKEDCISLGCEWYVGTMGNCTW